MKARFPILRDDVADGRRTANDALVVRERFVVRIFAKESHSIEELPSLRVVLDKVAPTSDLRAELAEGHASQLGRPAVVSRHGVRHGHSSADSSSVNIQGLDN